KLDDARIRVNADATRRNLEYDVTQWLPSVSQPGDTIFIYDSGHGGQIADDDGDEKDGLDEFLLPHDYIDPGILSMLVKWNANNQLKPEIRARLPGWLKLYGQGGDAGL